MGNPKAPSVPDPAKQYAAGIATNLKYAPQVAAAEYKLRGEYDDSSVEQNLDGQANYAPQAIDEYRKTLSTISPWSTQVRDQQAADVSADLAKGYSLDADQTRQVEQTTRAGQVASGNILGNAAVSKEATAVGKASFAAFNRRITGATTFLQQDQAIRRLTMTAALETKATTDDRADYYVAPDAGTSGQNTIENYYNQALAWVNGPGATTAATLSPWDRFARGFTVGYKVGSLGGIIGGIFGGLGGSFQGLLNSPDYQVESDWVLGPYGGHPTYQTPGSLGAQFQGPTRLTSPLAGGG